MAKKIVLYSKNGCVQCKALKRFFDKSSVIYDEFNIDEDPIAYKKAKSYGFTSAPIVEVPHKVLDLTFEAQKENSKIKVFQDFCVFSGFRIDLLGPIKRPESV